MIENIFSKKHFINWFSLVFILSTVIFITLNFQLVETQYVTAINNLFAGALSVFIFNIADKFLMYEKIDLFLIVFAFILGFISYFAFFPIIFYFVFLLFFFRSNLKILIVFTAALLIFSFLIQKFMIDTLTPDIFYWNIDWWWIIILYLITIYAGWIVADMQEVYFATGILAFIWVLIFWLSNDKTFLEAKIICTFIIPLPFFIVSFRRYKVDRSLGKVYKDL